MFGTIYIAGACQNGDSKWLEYHEKYASKLEAHLGMPVYNLKVVKVQLINVSLRYLMMLLMNGISTHCKGILIECRVQNSW